MEDIYCTHLQLPRKEGLEETDSKGQSKLNE